MSFKQDFKDAFDYGPRWYKIFSDRRVNFLVYLISPFASPPFLVLLKALTKRSDKEALDYLLSKDLFDPFGLFYIFFGD